MVKKFNEFIEEGFLSKTINRSKSGEKRLGDKSPIDNYLKNIEWVDLGHREYLFAKLDFEDRFTTEELLQIKKSLPNGIKMLTRSQHTWLKKKCLLNENKKDGVTFTSEINGEKIYFNNLNPDESHFVYYIGTPMGYDADNEEYACILEYKYGGEKLEKRDIDFSGWNKWYKNTRYTFKLIKSKKQ